MDDLTKHWNCLSLSEKEGDDLCIKKDCRSQEHIIAAFFLTQRALNTEAIARTFKPLWRAERGFKIQREGDHKLLFIFDNQEDVDRILANEPWSFDKSLVVLQRYDRNSLIEELNFDKQFFGCKFIIFPSGTEANQWLRTFVSQSVWSTVQRRIRRVGGAVS